MKKLTSVAIVVAILSQSVAMADCDFKTVTRLDDGSYKYSRECHLKVGEMKQDIEIKDSQIADYKKAIELKDLALVRTEQRADMWMNTSFKMEDRLNTIDELRSKNYVLYFILGVATTSLAVWGAGQLR
jgi:hypothetical protein